jgi:hypothetical protein
MLSAELWVNQWKWIVPSDVWLCAVEPSNVFAAIHTTSMLRAPGLVNGSGHDRALWSFP